VTEKSAEQATRTTSATNTGSDRSVAQMLDLAQRPWSGQASPARRAHCTRPPTWLGTWSPSFTDGKRWKDQSPLLGVVPRYAASPWAWWPPS